MEIVKSKTELIKDEIKNVVLDYIRLYPEEFAGVAKDIEEKRKLQKNQFSEVKGSDMVERALYETPETLFNMFLKSLSMDAHNWLSSKDGGRWFAKTFDVFKLADKI